MLGDREVEVMSGQADRLEAAVELVARAQQGQRWFDSVGGAEQAARAAEELRAQVLSLADDLLDARSSAIAELLEEDSVRGVAARLGMQPATLHKAHLAWSRRPTRPTPEES